MSIRPLHLVVLAALLFVVGCAARPPATVTPPRAEPSPALADPTPVLLSADPPPNDCFAPPLIETIRVKAETTGLTCCAYLHPSSSSSSSSSSASATRRATRIAYVQSGTGIYTTADADVGGLAPYALASGSFALLTIDKPGIGMDARRRLTLDRDQYRQHTLADLVACSRHALAWAAGRSTTIATDARLVLHGHSEGAQSIVRLLDARDPILDRVELAVLSGMPMEPMLHAVERQLAIFMPFEIDAFEQALARRDDAYLVDLGLPARYLEHPTAREGMDAVLADLARRRPGLRVEVFHGERDLNAPVGLVRSFARANERARSMGQPALDLRLHVYPRARHDLDAWTGSDLAALVKSLP